MKQTSFPKLEDELIQFYSNHQHPQDVVDRSAGKNWLQVTSGLNSSSPGSLPIRYRRPKQETNIASPGSNLIRAFNALFGIEPRDDMHGIERVVESVNALRGLGLFVDISRMKPDGFGVISLSDGSVRYELQSFKPIHFGFVQAETLRTDTLGRLNYRVFRRLMKYASTRKCFVDVEDLALASIFVPYHLLMNRVPQFFRDAPVEFLLLFADTDSPQQRSMALKYAESHGDDNPRLHAFCERIRSYREPIVLPLSRMKKAALP